MREVGHFVIVNPKISELSKFRQVVTLIIIDKAVLGLFNVLG
jgi:hypothetical protein